MDGTILIIEDDKDIRTGVRLILEGEGYSVVEASSGIEGAELVDKYVDLVILDVMMPGMSGFKTCEIIRKKSNVPVLFLTARSGDSDKLAGFMAGGDDYMVKPFTYAELLGRVRALMRRYRIYKGKNDDLYSDDNYIRISDIRINTEINEVYSGSMEINLSDIEYGILKLLMSQPSRIFSAEQIYEAVWKEPYLYSSNGTVMVHIRKLRVKIEKDPQEPKHIRTVWGKGYRFE